MCQHFSNRLAKWISSQMSLECEQAFALVSQPLSVELKTARLGPHGGFGALWCHRDQEHHNSPVFTPVDAKNPVDS